MSNVLFVKGHPSNDDTSVSVHLAERFLEAYKAANPSDTVTVLDLYKDNIPHLDADVLNAYGKFSSGRASEVTAEENVKVARINQLSDQFVASDKIIFAAPMWNFGYPSMVKAYMDTGIVAQGKTFRYTAEGPVGLLRGKGKKALILEASGGVYTGTPMEAHTHSNSHLKGILGFVGIDDVSFISAEGMNEAPEKRDEIVAEATNRAVALAATFFTRASRFWSRGALFEVNHEHPPRSSHRTHSPESR
jgi:FMN-dependent NADH-azoreductase